MTKLSISTAISPKFLAPLGQIAVDFASLEGILATRIWFLISINSDEDFKLGQIVTAELSFAKKVGLFRALYLYRFGTERIVELDDICKRLNQVENKRNVLTHSMWSETETADLALRVKITAKRRGHSIQRQRISLMEITDLIQQIGELIAELIMFLTLPKPANEDS